MNRVVYVGMDVHKELARVRASATKAKKRAKQNLISFLLRKGMVYPFGGRAKYWTQQFFAWLKTLEFAHLLDRYCFEVVPIQECEFLGFTFKRKKIFWTQGWNTEWNS